MVDGRLEMVSGVGWREEVARLSCQQMTETFSPMALDWDPCKKG